MVLRQRRSCCKSAPKTARPAVPPQQHRVFLQLTLQPLQGQLDQPQALPRGKPRQHQNHDSVKKKNKLPVVGIG